MGDPIFDDFAKTQVQFLQGGKQAKLNLDAHIALLDKIGSPVIVLTHSQGGEFGWQIADARPKLVKAIITAEPGGPPIKNVDISKIAYGAGAATPGALRRSRSTTIRRSAILLNCSPFSKTKPTTRILCRVTCRKNPRTSSST